MKPLRILTYKRTHTGDPDFSGQFGINDCMGSVRNRHFDAVIGVGGLGSEPKSWGIAGKLTWVGVGPRRRAGGRDRRGDVLSFERFVLLDVDGPDFRRIAPNLARRIFDGRVRALIDGYSAVEFREALSILELTRTVSTAHPGGPVLARPESECGVSCRRFRDVCSTRAARATTRCD